MSDKSIYSLPKSFLQAELISQNLYLYEMASSTYLILF
jgi:hypothetical protein